MSDDKRATIWRYFTDDVWYFWDMSRYPPRHWHETAHDRKRRIVRVGLLLLVTVLFASMWTLDVPDVF